MSDINAQQRVGQYIKRARANAKITQTDFADLLGNATGDKYHPSTISKIEAGNRPLSLEESAHIAQMLGLSPEEMFGLIAEQATATARLGRVSQSASNLGAHIRDDLLMDAFRLGVELEELAGLYSEGQLADEADAAVVLADVGPALEAASRLVQLLKMGAEAAENVSTLTDIEFASDFAQGR